MLWLRTLLFFLFFSLQHLYQCADDDVEFAHKVVGDKKDDWFGFSLATAYRHLVVGAPGDKKGSVLVEPGVKVTSPLENSLLFGESVDVNGEFIVASSQNPSSIFVYSAAHPYKMIQRIPVDEDFSVKDVLISDDNDYPNIICVATSDGNNQGFVTVYTPATDGSWVVFQKRALEGYYRSAISLAAEFSWNYHPFVAVGYDDNSGYGKVVVLHEYGIIQTITAPEPVEAFGVSISMSGNHIAVSSNLHNNSGSVIFTYHFDGVAYQFVYNGKLITPRSGLLTYSYLSLHNDLLAVTVSDHVNHPEVCALVYKLSKKNKNNSYNHSTTTNEEFAWQKHATLKTSGYPLKGSQWQSAVSVQDGLVFTGRMDYGEHGVGMVFVHMVS